jgi:orotidine-5'-phosphate decarboxylase
MTEVVLALDLPRADDALAFLDRIPAVKWVKVGSILMTREGPALIRSLVGRGLKVFLDLKWHDIPNTVAGAVASARDIGVEMATVHTLGGRAMLDAAVLAAGGELNLIGVTVLTSFDAASYGRAVGRPDVALPQEVERLGVLALDAGLRGVVCSAKEVSLLHRRLGPEPYLVVPGIRGKADPHEDQTRVASARDAAKNGATHLVVGRPVLQADDPAEALGALFKEVECIGS